jgi:hypothetical protein
MVLYTAETDQFGHKKLGGDSEEFQTGLVSAQTILEDSLPNRKYRITAYSRLGQIVELDAGPVDLAVP